jgi:long-chain acyl-CoA synthetase
VSVHWPIIRTLLRNPTRVAVVDDRRSYKGIEIVVGAMHLAGLIESKCSTPTVGTLLPSSGAFPLAALAGWSLGKAVVPLNFLLKPDELQYIIDDCETDTIITARPMLDFIKFTPKVKNLIFLDDVKFEGVPPLRWPASAGDDELAVLLYTSGTSGKPKGVMLSHGNLAANISQIKRWIPFHKDDVMLGVLPQFHSFGLTVLTLVPLTLGFKAVLVPRFVPAKIVQAMRQHRPTFFVAIPSMYGALLAVKDAGPDDFKSLRITVSGGEPLPEAIVDRMKSRFGLELNEGYGLTETSPVSNWCRPLEIRPHSVGKPLPDIDQRIVDMNTGRSVPQGHEGEIQMKGPNVMQGYFKLPAETAAAFTDDGYFRTGDIGMFDQDGHLHITGRLKEMMIIGGENVFPREIEEVLNKHASVVASGVVSTSDPLRGEQPIAFVEIKEGEAFDEQALKTWCRQSLAGYKVPVSIRHLPELPKNPTGKIMRRDLKKLI